MIYALDNEDLFFLSLLSNGMCLFVLKDHNGKTTTRFKEVFWSKQHHIRKIIEFLQSEDQANRNIGKTMLEQSLNIKIHF